MIMYVSGLQHSIWQQFLQLNKDRGTGQDPHDTVTVELLAAADPALRSVYIIIIVIIQYNTIQYSNIIYYNII